ncbi:DUF2292 domain-containing protein [Candidatus Formimonas warabiya]|nr:DUF2292 domain-containing protein [Candidatus Formimonas warabiya]
MKEATIKMTVTDKERKIIELIRSTGFGELKIVIQDQEPVRIEEITKSIKL